MATRIDNIFRIRDILDRPSPQAPAFTDLLRQCLSEEQDLLNEMSNTGKPWSMNTFEVNYYPNQTGVFDVPVTDLGQVLFVTRLFNNPYIKELPVPIDDIDQALYGTVWTWYSSWLPFTAEHTPERMSFYREGVTPQSYKLRVQPMPQESCIYVVRYVPNSVQPTAALQTATAMPEFATLLQYRASAALLPHAKWGDDEAMNAEKRNQMKMSLEYVLPRKEAAWKEYRRQLTKARTVNVSDWNSDY